MSKTPARARARRLSYHDGTPTRVVCAALALALLVLAARIAAIW